MQNRFMKIISLRSYRKGFTGIIEEDDKYVLFICPKNGTYKRLLNYYKEDYPSYERFAGVISKFAPPSFFLKEPIYVKSMTFAELERHRK